MKLALIRTAVTVTALGAVLACGSDTTGQSNDIAVGSYFATQFVTTGSFGQINQLIQGSTATIDLLPDGRTAGHLHLVPTAANPGLDADLAGTWRRNGNVVTFSQSADTFIRNLEFTVVLTSTGVALVADQVVGGVRIQITLAEGGAI